MQQTLDRLKALHLDAMADALAAQAHDPGSAKLDFDERLGLLVEAQWTARENKRLRRALAEGLDLILSTTELIRRAGEREVESG